MAAKPQSSVLTTDDVTKAGTQQLAIPGFLNATDQRFDYIGRLCRFSPIKSIICIRILVIAGRHKTVFQTDKGHDIKTLRLHRAGIGRRDDMFSGTVFFARCLLTTADNSL